MASDTVELLDRQHERLRARERREFVIELRRFYDFITTGPEPVTSALADLRSEAERIEREFEEHDEALVPELVKLKDDLVERAPEVDDSNVQRPQRPGAPPAAWMFSVANFDQVASGGPERTVRKQGWDSSRSGMLLRILETKLRLLQQYRDAEAPAGRQPSDVNLRQDLDDLARRLRNLSARHRHAAQAFGQSVETHGGFQVLYLDVAVKEMNPAPQQVESEADEHAWMDESVRRFAGGWQVLADAAATGRSLDEIATRTLDVHVNRLKPAAERVHEDIRMRLAVAPPPAAAEPVPEARPARSDYGERLKQWVLSPGYALLGGPCLSGVLTQVAAGESEGVVLLLLGAVVFALVPPAWQWATRWSYTGWSTAFILLTTAVFVAVLVLAGLGWALLVFVLLVGAFSTGQHASASK